MSISEPRLPGTIAFNETDFSQVLLPSSNIVTHAREYYDYNGTIVNTEINPPLPPPGNGRFYTTADWNVTPEYRREFLAADEPRAPENAQAPGNNNDWPNDLDGSVNGDYWAFRYTQYNNDIYYGEPYNPAIVTEYHPMQLTVDQLRNARYDIHNYGLPGLPEAPPPRFLDLETELREVLGSYIGEIKSEITAIRIRKNVEYVLSKHGIGRTNIDVHFGPGENGIRVDISPRPGENPYQPIMTKYEAEKELREREINEQVGKMEKIELSEDVF